MNYIQKLQADQLSVNEMIATTDQLIVEKLTYLSSAKFAGIDNNYVNASEVYNMIAEIRQALQNFSPMAPIKKATDRKMIDKDQARQMIEYYSDTADIFYKVEGRLRLVRWVNTANNTISYFTSADEQSSAMLEIPADAKFEQYPRTTDVK